MQSHILKCQPCAIYTMKEKCPNCGTSTSFPRPAKFSPEDKYKSYRRQAKKEMLASQGLI